VAMRFGIVLAVLVGVGSSAQAEEAASSPETVTVRLKDGSVLVGEITASDERHVAVQIASGATVDLPRASVVSIETGRPPDPETRALVEDETRLFLAPTGRPLRRGFGYFSDHYVFLPGLAYGVSDHITLAGGMSLVPGIGLGNQVGYFTPKVGARLGDHAAVSAGALLAGSGDGMLSVGYAVTSLGADDRSLSAGVGFGRTGDGDDTQPIIMVGGATRVSRRVSFVTENWFFPGEEYALFSGGFRIRSDRITVDVGLVTTGELLDGGDGLPAVPWLSFAYHFGGRGLRASYRAAR
jgi:hypothetical protein